MTAYNKKIPLIAILRGVSPQQIIDVADVLIAEGISMIEVPLNSLEALTSIKLLIQEYGTDNLLLGAGTVTTPQLAEQVLATGANLIVAPNTNRDVIQLAIQSSAYCLPGIVTPTEAFNAIEAGAKALKLFPVSMVGVDGIKAMNSVLSNDIDLFPVGGITAQEQSMKPYWQAGVAGFGIGSALFKPTMTLAELRANAQRFVNVFEKLTCDK